MESTNPRHNRNWNRRQWRTHNYFYISVVIEVFLLHKFHEYSHLETAQHI